MIKKIIFSLGIDALPKWLVFDLSIISGILGAFNAFLFTYSLSGFITDHLIPFFPEAMAISGILGILLYYLHKYLLKTVPPRYYVTIFFGTVLLLFIIPLIFTSISLSFWLFICWFPVTMVIELAFLSIATKIPIVKENQNLRRFLEAGVLAGTAFFSFLITLLSLFHIKIPILIPGV